MPPPHLEVGVGVACDLGYPCAKFRLPRPFGFRVRADMYATSDRQTDDGRRWPPNAPPPYGRGIIRGLLVRLVNCLCRGWQNPAGIHAIGYQPMFVWQSYYCTVYTTEYRGTFIRCSLWYYINDLSLSAWETDCQHGLMTPFTKRNISEIWGNTMPYRLPQSKIWRGRVPRVLLGIYAYEWHQRSFLPVSFKCSTPFNRRSGVYMKLMGKWATDLILTKPL